MIFQTPRRDYTVEIPDDWWRFAEMERFAISPGGAVPCDEEVLIVSVDEVEPPRRNTGVTLLKKYKLMPVLFAFNSPECALPSIEVYESRAVAPLPIFSSQWLPPILWLCCSWILTPARYRSFAV
jgi:hypothetical protein